MINIILSGCNGRMGKVISSLAKDDENINIVCGFDINTEKNFDYPVYSDYEKFDGNANVIIDFSHPSNLENILNYGIKRNIAMVIATTGLSDDELNKVYEAAKKVPVFFIANISRGVNLMVNLAKQATKLLYEKFDIEILEKHHNQKLDAPSGTALMLANAIKEEIDGETEFVFDRHSVRKKRDKKEIGISAIRGGNIVGEHTVIYAGCDEIVEITHKAASRDVFAIGALAAAKFLSGKGKGMYDMQDVINS